MPDIYSDASRWIYGIVITSVVVPLASWLKKNKDDKNKLVAKVDRLEEKVNSIDDKLDTEIGERRLIEGKIDRLDEKFDKKMDNIADKLTQVVINTAINSDKLDTNK